MAEKDRKDHDKDGGTINRVMGSLMEAANNMNIASLSSTPLGMVPVPPPDKKNTDEDEDERLR